MKIVTFNRDMRPYGAGDHLVVPDAMATELEADGAVRDVRPFPPAVVAPPKPDVAPETPGEARRAARHYLTRKGI